MTGIICYIYTKYLKRERIEQELAKQEARKKALEDAIRTTCTGRPDTGTGKRPDIPIAGPLRTLRAPFCAPAPATQTGFFALICNRC